MVKEVDNNSDQLSDKQSDWVYNLMVVTSIIHQINTKTQYFKIITFGHHLYMIKIIPHNVLFMNFQAYPVDENKMWFWASNSGNFGQKIHCGCVGQYLLMMGTQLLITCNTIRYTHHILPLTTGTFVLRIHKLGIAAMVKNAIMWNDYSSMHYFGNSRHCQSMIAYYSEWVFLEIPVKDCIVRMPTFYLLGGF